MSEPIGPGDWVECIAPTRSGCVVGHIYCVSEIVPACGLCPACGEDKDDGMLFVGQAVYRSLDYPGLVLSWCPCRFRPIYRPKSELIQLLLAPAPKRTRKTRESA